MGVDVWAEPAMESATLDELPGTLFAEPEAWEQLLEGATAMITLQPDRYPQVEVFFDRGLVDADDVPAFVEQWSALKARIGSEPADVATDALLAVAGEAIRRGWSLAHDGPLAGDGAAGEFAPLEPPLTLAEVEVAEEDLVPDVGGTHAFPTGRFTGLRIDAASLGTDEAFTPIVSEWSVEAHAGEVTGDGIERGAPFWFDGRFDAKGRFRGLQQYDDHHEVHVGRHDAATGIIAGRYGRGNAAHYGFGCSFLVPEPAVDGFRAYVREVVEGAGAAEQGLSLDHPELSQYLTRIVDALATGTALPERQIELIDVSGWVAFEGLARALSTGPYRAFSAETLGFLVGVQLGAVELVVPAPPDP
jgi:hypothetical protein